MTLASGCSDGLGSGHSHRTSAMLISSSCELVEQCLRLFQIGGVEPLGEPGVDWREKVARFGVATLVAAEPGEARGGAQFPELGPLLLGDAHGFAIELLGGLGIPLPQKQL